MINYFLKFLLTFLFVSTVFAVDIAPRISDKEIIESLADIKATQKTQFAELKNEIQANQKINSVKFGSIEKRFEQVDKRFEQIDKQFESLRSDMNTRFETLRSDMNSRIDTLTNTMLVMFSSLIALIVALFGYIIWDRRTAMKTLAEKLDSLEKELIRDLGLRNEAGSVLTRLANAMREYGKKNPEMSKILNAFSLL